MTVQWSGVGPGLLLELRRGAGPLREQLEMAFRTAIQTGRLRPGERLPSSRELAGQLEVSRRLITECYDQLRAEGYLDSRPGAHTTVASGVLGVTPRASDLPGQGRAWQVDFRRNIPDLGSFPRGDWAWAVSETVRRIPRIEFDYGESAGAAHPRAVVAAYLRRVRGAIVTEQSLMFCTGFTQGLSLVLASLASLGIDRVAFEDPGPYGLDLPVRAGVTPIAVPVDEEGVDVAALAATGARAVVVTPAHQSPTGVVLSARRRHELIEWARSVDGFVIEDDYDAEYRYDKGPVGVLQGLDPSRVALIGTVSKALAPALRLGWIAPPAELASTVLTHKHDHDNGTSRLDQHALAALMESGRFDRHLRRMRRTYAQRRATLVRTVTELAPAVRLTGLAAGLLAAAVLPDHVDENHVVAEAARRGIALSGMAFYRMGTAPLPPGIVFGYGSVREAEIQSGVRAIADLLQ